MAFAKERSKIKVESVLFGLCVLAVYTLVQLVPLPPSVVATVSPSAGSIWDGALVLAERPGTWRSLSVAPVATAVEFAKLSILIVTFVLSAMWTRVQGHHPLLTALAFVGLVCAVVAIAHRLLGAELVYGLYEPRESRGAWASAPLLNPNHLAAMMVLCAPLAVGLGLESRERPRRFLWFIAATVMSMAAVLSLSRGGIAALVLASGLLAVLVSRKIESVGNAWRDRAWIALGVLALLCGGAYVAFDAAYIEFLEGGDSKSFLWVASWPMILAFFPFGVGRGAYISTFSTFGDFNQAVTYHFAENMPVQWAAEWGLLGLAAVVLLWVVVVRLAMRGSHRPAVTGAIAGVGGFLVHNLADFSIELVGVAVPAVAMLAVIATRRRGQGKYLRRKLPVQLVAGFAAVLVIAGGVVTYWASSRTLAQDESLLRAHALEENSSFDVALAGATIARHPADSMIAYLIGIWAFRDGHVNPMPWLSRAIERRPGWGQPHLWVARTLSNSGRTSQALMEYRVAAQREARLLRPIAREVVERWPEYDSLRPLVEVEPPPLDVWDALCEALARQRLRDEAELANRALLEVVPDHVPALERAISAAIRSEQLDEAQSLVARLRHDNSASTTVLRARIKAASGELDQAVAFLQEGLSREPEDRSLLRYLARLEEERGDIGAARTALDQLEQITPRARRGGIIVLRAALEERAGRDAEALVFYRQADAMGGGDAALRGLARTAERQGAMTLAMEAYRRLREHGVDITSLETQRRRPEGQYMGRALDGGVADDSRDQ